MSASHSPRRRFWVQGVGALAFVMVLVASKGALAITFGDWATAKDWPVGYATPSTVSANSQLIDSLVGMGSYNWTETPTITLYLYNNQITSIESGDFSGLGSLTYLGLSNNQITNIESGDFSGLGSLTTLALSSNRIVNIESGDFSGLGSLINLDLTSNQITSIESGDFSGLGSLTYLHLTGNQITNIESGDFSSLGSLTCLYLAHNQITSIEPDDFSGLGSLMTLYLYSNRITSIESGDFSGLGSLTTLYLSYNRITSIESDDFSGLGSLTYLYLSDNQIAGIESGCFSGMGGLEVLSLANNVALTDLNLEGADFSSLQYLDVDHDTAIHHVSLRGTNLNQIALTAIGNGIGELPGVTELDLSGVDFSAITDYSPLYTLDHLIDLWLLDVENMDALKLDTLLDNLAAMEDPGIEGVLHMTRADYDVLNAAGGGLLAFWDAESGHSVEMVGLGDANADGLVDDADATILASHWHQATGANWFDGDFNGDGAVDDRDASILASHWHEGAEGHTPNVPEAGVFVLLAGMAVTGAVGMRRGREKG